MVNKTNIQFDKALDLINEADILLFRGQGFISKLIQRAGEGMYSHVGLATWHNGRKRGKVGDSLLEITEFREGKGGRTVDLATAYENDLIAGNIDVYRLAHPIYKLKLDKINNVVVRYEMDFNAKGITNYLRSLTGLPYGWSRIWWIAKHKLAGFRIFYNIDDVSDDDRIEEFTKIYPVCSTAVAASYSHFGIDLVPNRSTDVMEPNDIARSSCLNYLFTLTK